jgi:hypothetical protein
MKKIPLATSNRRRAAAKEPFVALKNRFVEANPVLSDNGPAYIQRPALSYWTSIGMGPIRAINQQPGAFNDDAFAVSYDQMFRLDRTNGLNGGNRAIYSGLAGADEGAAVNSTFTGDIGEITPRFYFCDGNALFCYTEDGFATGTLNASSVADGDVVQIGGVYYRLSSGSLDSGAPAGTAGNPWRVLSTGTIIQVFTRLYNAINATGEPGTDYSTALVDPHPTVTGTFASATQMRIRANAEGLFGNGISTTETGANMAWGAATTTGGGDEGVIPIPTPEGVGVIDVVSLNNFVVVIPAQGEGLNGRFYWVEPGELTIDPLNFATAERSADPINSARVFGDQLWNMGQNSTEPWYLTGNLDAPFQRLQGVVFDRGVHQGTAVQVKGSICLVDSFGGVFMIQGGEKRISTPDIEEVLRKAIAKQNAKTA